jgi:drug/metabolite transporter (DMT)-like permease
MNKQRLFMFLGDLGLLIVAFIWGLTNVVMRDALKEITPFWFCALRFSIAFAVVFVLFGHRAFRVTRRIKVAGSLIGIIFISAYIVGAPALLFTTAGNQSFIISTSVVFVPICVWMLSGKFPGWHIVIAVLLCTVGMGGMMLDATFTINFGDVLCFVSMMFVTAHILLVQKFVATEDPYALACWQSLGGMILAVLTALIFEPFPAHITRAAWIAVIYAATAGFALTIVLQTVAQKYTTATHAAILLSTSGVFGRMLGIIFLGEPMTARIMISSALVLVGVIIAEAYPAKAAKSKNGEPATE